jgi:hypothetical protein
MSVSRKQQSQISVLWTQLFSLDVPNNIQAFIVYLTKNAKEIHIKDGELQTPKEEAIMVCLSGSLSELVWCKWQNLRRASLITKGNSTEIRKMDHSVQGRRAGIYTRPLNENSLKYSGIQSLIILQIDHMSVSNRLSYSTNWFITFKRQLIFFNECGKCSESVGRSPREVGPTHKTLVLSTIAPSGKLALQLYYTRITVLNKLGNVRSSLTSVVPSLSYCP